MPFATFLYIRPRKNMRRKLHILIALCSLGILLGSTAAFAQRTKVFGVVRDQQGNPVELASVRVQGTAVMTATDLQGRYSLYCERRDSILLLYSQIGYTPRRRLLRGIQSDSVRLDVVLPTMETALEAATVQGQSTQTTTEQRIKMTDVATMPSTMGNGVEEVIQAQAGVSTHNELSSQYNVRGGSFDENVVYINGIEVYRPMLVRSGNQEGLSIINPDMVERISFSSGGFEARYGDKMSSVLDITYKRPDHAEGRAYASMLGG